MCDYPLRDDTRRYLVSGRRKPPRSYNSNVHTNCQALGRPWKKIREQADSYIQVLKTRARGDSLYVTVKGYEQCNVNDESLSPVCKYVVRVPLHELQYDSRYFRTVFLNRELSAFEKLKNMIDYRGV